MFYVFHVGLGQFWSFPMTICLGTVEQLKQEIFRNHGIPPEFQVLLISGGEILQSNALVTTYTGGQIESPIYLFSLAISDPRTNTLQSSGDVGTSWEKRVQWSITHDPPSLETLQSRAILAAQLHECGTNEVKKFAELVKQQHMQQQGWCAVVANLEDTTKDFETRSNEFYRFYEEHIKTSEQYYTYLATFNEDLDRLSQIKILPSLLQYAELKPFCAFDEVYKDKELNIYDKSHSNDGSVSESLSLLEWILAKNTRQILSLMAQNCTTELGRFNREVLEARRTEVKRVIEDASRLEIKEIPGLSERLQGLDRLAQQADAASSSQHNVMVSIQNNVTNLTNKNNQYSSVIPDLCQTSQTHLMISLADLKKICDIRLRAERAKEELGSSLSSRLKDIIDIQNRMQLYDGHNMTSHAYLLRVHRHLSIVEQIHRAPAVYASAVSEVVRRREFSTAFLAWAKELAGRLSAIYNDEIERRNAICEDLDGHFLVNLFPGMDDVPAPFAIEAPPLFDASLPVLSRGDIVELSKQHPELANELSLFQNAEPVIKFFTECRNYVLLATPQEITTEAATETQTLKPPDLHAHLKDLEKGFESETDTEEFEKVSQSPIDRISAVQTASQINPTVILPSTTTIKPEMTSVETSTFNVETNNMETLTDENFETTQSEITRLRSLLQQLEQKSLSSIASLRIELKEAKLEVTKTSDAYNEDITKLRTTLKVLEDEAKNRERELVQRLTVDHELEMNDIRKNLSTKEEEMQAIRNEKTSIEAEHMESVSLHESEKGALRDAMDKLNEELKDVRKELETLQATKEQEIADIKEQLIKERKAETELMRSRIRMLTSVDRSPSDTSLEKIESPNMIDITSHEAILAQLKLDFEKEKQSAIAAALELERSRHESASKPVPVGSPSRSNAMTTETVLRRMIDDREKRLDELRGVELILRKENLKLKDTIAQSLSESDNGSLNAVVLREEVDKLKKDKELLETELMKEKQRRGKLNKRYVPLNIKHCEREDIVLVTWSPAHQQYTVYQDNQKLHVVNEHCYPEMGLTLPPADTLPTQLFALGTVIDREYCHARRPNNRYRIESGAKFYRVKLARSSYVLSPAVSTAAASTNRSVNVNNPSSMEMSTASTITRSISESCTGTLTAESTNTALVDSCAQTDLEPAGQGDDMVDSGVSEQQKSMCRSQRTISEEIETQLDEASAAVDPSEEAYKQNLGEDICVIDREIHTSSISSMNTSNIGLDDVDPLTDEFHSLDTKPEENL